MFIGKCSNAPAGLPTAYGIKRESSVLQPAVSKAVDALQEALESEEMWPDLLMDFDLEGVVLETWRSLRSSLMTVSNPSTTLIDFIDASNEIAELCEENWKSLAARK